jgi:two-component system sensor histidine kinase KdpD
MILQTLNLLLLNLELVIVLLIPNPMDKDISFNFLEKSSYLLHYFLVALIVSFITGICFIIQPVIGYQSVAFILLLMVSILPLFFMSGPVIVAATQSAILWNFLFIPPLFTLHIDKLEDALMFSMYFIIAIITSVLTSRIKFQKGSLDIEKKELGQFIL